MPANQDVTPPPEIITDVLSYLNFSSGSRDPKFFRAINSLYRNLLPSNKDSRCAALRIIALLEQQLAVFARKSEAFHAGEQAGQVLALVKNHFLPEYRQFHDDLLHHQTDETLFNAFFLAKIFETVLRQGSPWTEHGRIVSAVIDTLDDYIGYRPVPVLEGAEKHQPYSHEWCAPIPLYIDSIGIAAGRYENLIKQALNILRETDPQILRAAYFDPDKLQEIVLDPRAYDFDHPVNRKPNYHFGMWDPNFIDNDGFYRRFVIHQVTADCMLRRIETAYTGESHAADAPMEHLLYEAGAVLAGTMLMGSGVCGDNPSAYGSETSLNDLMPVIADYRDQFYSQLMHKIPAAMKPRLAAEQQRLFQPFGGCRQDLNRQMAKRRADQLQRMNLARLFARMGYADAATEQTAIIAVASARMMTAMDCLITDTHLKIDQEQLDEAAENLPKIEDLLRRGISCGAVIDPWTIYGFGGAFNLFHTVENSIHDHRIDDLINILEEIFDLYSRLQKEAAASGKRDLQGKLSDKMSDLAGWWDQYGTTEVSNLDSFSGDEAWESAAVVSTALAAWHKAGTAAGDVAFWSKHVERFKTTKAFVLLAEALLDQQDPVASMNLMMYWLDRSAEIPLVEGDYSFYSIALRWMDQLWRQPAMFQEGGSGLPKAGWKQTVKEVPPLAFTEKWNLTRKFFELTEANADAYWYVPSLDLDDDMFEGGQEKKGSGKKKPEEDNGKSDEKSNTAKRTRKDDDIYGAAYEDFTFQDSADDGIDDMLMDAAAPGGGFHHRDEEPAIVPEIDRINDRLMFISTMSKLWKFVTEHLAGYLCVPKDSDWQLPAVKAESADLTEDMQAEIAKNINVWLAQIETYNTGLEQLLRRTSAYKVPPPRGTTDSLLEYDRHRGMKEVLLDRIVWTVVEVRDVRMVLESYNGTVLTEEMQNAGRDDWEIAVLKANTAVFRCDVKALKKHWTHILNVLSKETILYVPTSRGGSAAAIVRCRSIQQGLLRLLENLPRLGLIVELFKLLETIQMMEEMNTVAPGAITEFDRLVETAARSLTKCVVASAKTWKFSRNAEKERQIQNTALVDYMEMSIEHLLAFWLSHSRQIRISPVESLVDKEYWHEIKQIVQLYGHDIFTQQNMGFGNLRAILHQGVDNYLQSLIKIKQEEGETPIAAKLLKDLETGRIHWEAAVAGLEIVFESIAENYAEYVDYNSTTTHSDRGEKLYMLLDMLRVEVGYERVSWNLKPVYWVHDAMIRAGCDEAALLWERAVERRSSHAAEEHLRHYQRLSEKYGMWLPSVHERLQERFVRPLQIARMCGLVPKAIRQIRQEGTDTAFEELHRQIENFAKNPMGVGFEIPEWLSALQNEVMTTRTDTAAAAEDDDGDDPRDVFNSPPHFEQACLTKPQLDKIIHELNQREKYLEEHRSSQKN
ncbi:MAG: hypothetical protein LBH00_05755 [Planctomycetaceae bacterium]|nr:hypothetical protein [Planctomycetaceae bacterium]